MKLNLIGKIGLAIGLLGGLAGLAAAAIFGGVQGKIMAVIFLFAFGLPIWFMLFKPMLRQNRLEKTGIRTTAVIKEIHETGITINNNPVPRFVLEVKNPYGAPFVANVKFPISRLQIGMFQPGSVIPVLADPNNPNEVVLDTEGGETSQQTVDTDKVLTGQLTGMSKMEVANLLREVDENNKKIFSYGTECRAIVSKYIWLGINVNGNNPFVEIEAEVLPQNIPSFHCKCRAVIMEQSIQMYQPGEEIFVKYDPTDMKKVTISHS